MLEFKSDTNSTIYRNWEDNIRNWLRINYREWWELWQTNKSECLIQAEHLLFSSSWLWPWENRSSVARAFDVSEYLGKIVFLFRTKSWNNYIFMWNNLILKCRQLIHSLKNTPRTEQSVSVEPGLFGLWAAILWSLIQVMKACR